MKEENEKKESKKGENILKRGKKEGEICKKEPKGRIGTNVVKKSEFCME